MAREPPKECNLTASSVQRPGNIANGSLLGMMSVQDDYDEDEDDEVI